MVPDAYVGATSDDDYVMGEEEDVPAAATTAATTAAATTTAFATVPEALANELRSKVTSHMRGRVRCDISACATSDT